MAQKSWPTTAPARAAAACKRGYPRHHVDRQPVPRRPVLAVEQLEDQRRQRVDAGVAGADQRHGAALGGEIERYADASLFLRSAASNAVACRRSGRRQIEIEADSRRHRSPGASVRVSSEVRQSAPAGADADDAEPAAPPPHASGIDVAGGAGDGAGGAA